MAADNFVQGLVNILVKDGVIDVNNAASLVNDFAGRSKVAIDYFLVDEGLVQKDDLLSALSKYYHVPALDVQGELFEAPLVQSFPKEFLLEHGVIPLRIDGEVLIVVAYQPDKEGLAGKIEEYTSFIPEFRVGLLRDIIDSVREFYDDSSTSGDEDEYQLREEGEDEMIDIDQIPDESI